jgi:hypothetical protein
MDETKVSVEMIELLWPAGSTVDTPRGRGIIRGHADGVVIVQPKAGFSHYSVQVGDLVPVVNGRNVGRSGL